MQTKFLHKYPSATNEIGIAFSPNVKVTTTDMLKPTVSGLLSKVDSIAVSIFVVIDFDTTGRFVVCL